MYIVYYRYPVAAETGFGFHIIIVIPDGYYFLRHNIIILFYSRVFHKCIRGGIRTYYKLFLII